MVWRPGLSSGSDLGYINAGPNLDSLASQWLLFLAVTSPQKDCVVFDANITLFLYGGYFFRQSAKLDLQNRMQLFTPDLSAALFLQQLIHFPQFFLQLIHPRQIHLPLLFQHTQESLLILCEAVAFPLELESGFPHRVHDLLRFHELPLDQLPRFLDAQGIPYRKLAFASSHVAHPQTQDTVLRTDLAGHNHAASCHGIYCAAALDGTVGDDLGDHAGPGVDPRPLYRRSLHLRRGVYEGLAVRTADSLADVDGPLSGSDTRLPDFPVDDNVASGFYGSLVVYIPADIKITCCLDRSLGLVQVTVYDFLRMDAELIVFDV